MAEFTVGGRAYRLERLRLGEIKALARINEEAIDPAPDAMLHRYARMVEAVTARFGAEGFVASDDSECSAAELSAAAVIALTLGGFIAGEATAAAR